MAPAPTSGRRGRPLTDEEASLFETILSSATKLSKSMSAEDDVALSPKEDIGSTPEESSVDEAKPSPKKKAKIVKKEPKHEAKSDKKKPVSVKQESLKTKEEPEDEDDGDEVEIVSPPKKPTPEKVEIHSDDEPACVAEEADASSVKSISKKTTFAADLAAAVAAEPEDVKFLPDGDATNKRNASKAKPKKKSSSSKENVPPTAKPAKLKYDSDDSGDPALNTLLAEERPPTTPRPKMTPGQKTAAKVNAKAWGALHKKQMNKK